MSTPTSSLREALQLLREHELRVTPARKQLVEMLFAASEPLSVEMFHVQFAAASRPDVVTVYRTLSVFETIGLVSSVVLPGEESVRYELSSPFRVHHHHVVCVSCGQVEDVSVCLPSSLQEEVSESSGMRIDGHVLEWKGVCSACSRL